MDARGSDKKLEPECYGDVVVWFQLIDYAKQENKPIVLVTDDGKEDWWQESHGKKYGPRPELRQEMFSRAQVSFYLYTGDQFLEHAEKFLDLTSEPDVVEEAREVRLEEAMAQQSHKDEQQLVDQANQLFHALDSLKGPDLSALRAGNLSELVKGFDFSTLRGAELADLKNRFGLDSQMLENMRLRELQSVLAGIDPKTLQAISDAGGLAGAISGLASPISNANAKPQRQLNSVQNQQPEGFNPEVPEESEPNPEVEE